MPTDLLSATWKMLLVRGLIGIVFGIVLIAWPDTTIVVLVVLWGIWAVVDGIVLAAQIFSSPGGTGQKALVAGLALVAILAGLIAIARPGLAASVVTWFIGIWLLVRGLFELVGAFTSRSTAPRWLLVLGALLDLLLGALFVANPGNSAVAIAVLLGIIALAWGIVFVVLALLVRRRAAEVDRLERAA